MWLRHPVIANGDVPMQIKRSILAVAVICSALFLSSNIWAQNQQEETKKPQLMVPMAPAIPEHRPEEPAQPGALAQPSQVIPPPVKKIQVPEYKKAKKEQPQNPQ